MRHSESTRLDQRRSRAGSGYPARGTGHLPARIKTGCTKIQPWQNCTQSFPIIRNTAHNGALLHTKTVAASMRETALIEAAPTSTPLWPVGRYTVNCCPNSAHLPESVPLTLARDQVKSEASDHSLRNRLSSNMIDAATRQRVRQATSFPFRATDRSAESGLSTSGVELICRIYGY